jgi:hypothetical protein
MDEEHDIQSAEQQLVDVRKRREIDNYVEVK